MDERLGEKLPGGGFEDRLELLGVLAGGFLVLAGLGTLIGAPWQYQNSLGGTVLQLLGIVGTIAVGAGLIWISQTQRDELPWE